MMSMQELDRIGAGEGLLPPPAAAWSFELDLGDVPERTMERVLTVVREVASTHHSEWPSDEQWKERLPQWLVHYMPDLSIEECERLMNSTPRERWNTLPWQFGSWLDAMRERGWEWWGYERTGRNAALVLSVTDMPPRVEAFKQILLAAGGKVVSERY